MTVAELIKELEKMPQDAQVFIYGEQFQWGYDEMSVSYVEYITKGNGVKEEGVWFG